MKQSVEAVDLQRPVQVEAAIQELNYHPNHVARSLKTSKTRTLGIMVPDITISFFPQVIRGAETAARKRGYTVIAVNSDDDAERQKDLLSLFRSQRVEGILLVIAAGPTPLNQISRILDAGIPIVCLDRIPDRIAVDSVSVEDVQAAELRMRPLDESARLVLHADVHRKGARPAAAGFDLLHERLEPLSPARAQRHGRARPGQGQRRRLADPR